MLLFPLKSYVFLCIIFLYIYSNTIPEAECAEEEDINPFDNFPISSSETAIVPELSYEVVDDSNITIAPGEDRIPLPVI